MTLYPDDLRLPLRTPRLLIAPPRAGEGVAVNEAIVASFPALSRWMPWAKKLPSVEESETHSREAARDVERRQDLVLRLWDPSGSIVLGSTGLHPRVTAPELAFEIGYWVRSSHVGRGLASEATRAVVTYAFDVLHARRLVIRCDTHNAASARVAERCGFKQTETISDGLDNQGRPRATRIYERSRAVG